MPGRRSVWARALWVGSILSPCWCARWVCRFCPPPTMACGQSSSAGTQPLRRRSDSIGQCALHFVLGAAAPQLQATLLPAGHLAGAHLHLYPCAESSHHSLLVPRLCPLGALLGIVSRWSVLGLVKNPEHCNDCNRCLLRCQGGDDPIGGVPWHQPECHLCLNCVDECPEHGLQFKFFPAQKVSGRQSAETQSSDWIGRGGSAGSAVAQHSRIRGRAP